MRRLLLGFLVGTILAGGTATLGFREPADSMSLLKAADTQGQVTCYMPIVRIEGGKPTLYDDFDCVRTGRRTRSTK